MLPPLPAAQLRTPDQLLAGLTWALAIRQRSTLEAYFENPKRDSAYLFSMAANRGGYTKVKVCLLPVPPGWSGYGRYWAVFHSFQTIEEDHDPVYRVDDTVDGLRLGREIPEDDLAGWRIDRQSYRARIDPDGHAVSVQVVTELDRGKSQRAPVFRLNDIYRVEGAVEETATHFLRPLPGQTVRAGSLLIRWTSEGAKRFDFSYSARLPAGSDDEIVSNAAYVTAWWLPSLGRLPFTVRGVIDVPSSWTARAEGLLERRTVSGGRSIWEYACPLPISFPKIVAGSYSKAASASTANGDRFAVYQLQPADRRRAERDLKSMMRAAAFYESLLGPLPFAGYECYDADRFYGIESYSHTLLQRDVTHFLSHEMGHSYFGGLVPCSYVHDSWNEGVTQYVDSVLLNGDRDRSLENGPRTTRVPVPLSEMAVPWSNGGASYWRGCYVMKMLEAEIGRDKVAAALRSLVRDRRGKDTRWDDLRPYFEAAAGKRLDWFWKQWIDQATFPRLTMWSDHPQATDSGFATLVHVAQAGTASPYRIRFDIRSGHQWQPVLLETQESEFVLKTAHFPAGISLDLFPFSLATVETRTDTGRRGSSY